jgi:alpha-soluble NSF attachment protein
MSELESESRGLALMDEANKLFKRQSIWNMFNASQKFEDAKEKYTKAANLFKMSKSWMNAGACAASSSPWLLLTPDHHRTGL